MKTFNRITLLLSLVLATVGAHAGQPLVIGISEDGALGQLDLATLKGEMGRRVEQRDMTVPAHVAVVRMTATGPRAIGGFDGSCSLVDAERFRDGTSDRTANDSTRELLKSAGALVRVADQQRIALRFVSICVVTDRPQDYAGLLKLPPPGLVARAEGTWAYVVLPGGLVMFTL